MKNLIPITKAIFDEEDFALIQEPLKSGWVVQGKYVKEFEDLFSDFTNCENSIATSSCTTALHICVSALGIKAGEEALVPAFTWVATANCLEFQGAKPVFVDIDLKTFNIDPEKIEEKISPLTKGIIPVHLFGLVCDMDSILKISKSNNLWVVEDAACGFDSWYKGIHAGNFGDFGCFSFHPRKSITTGEGGMITTNNSEYATICRSLRDHGASKSDLERHTQKFSFLLSEYNRVGYNYRMTDIQGALGVTQIKKAKKIMESRRNVSEKYDKLLSDLGWLNLPFRDKDYIHGQQSYVCLYAPESPTLGNWEKLHSERNRIMANLEDKGIITRQGTHAACHLNYYKNRYGIKITDYPNAFLAEMLSITLPVYYGMSDNELDFVVSSLKNEFKDVRK